MANSAETGGVPLLLTLYLDFFEIQERRYFEEYMVMECLEIDSGNTDIHKYIHGHIVKGLSGYNLVDNSSKAEGSIVLLLMIEFKHFSRI